MRKTIVIGGVLLLMQITLLALTLLQEKTWGGIETDEATEVAVGIDGSVYVAGTTLSFGAGDRDAFLLKYNPDGSLAWDRTYGTPPVAPFTRADEFGLGLAVAGDGSAYITGQFAGGVLFLAKFDSAGLLVWDLTWGENGTIGNGLAIGTDGSVYVSGLSFVFGAGQSDAVLVKFSSEGALLWQRTWGGTGFDAARAIAAAPDGGAYIAGETNSFFANDAFLVKFDANGDVVWERDWAAEGADAPFTGLTAAYGVTVAPDTSIYITGNAFDTGERTNVILVKFDAAGNVIWERVGGPEFAAATDVAVAPADGAVFVSGNMSSDDPDVFGGWAFVAEFTAGGKAKKANSWGSVVPNENTSAESIAVAPDGTIVTAGYVGAPPYELDRGSNSARAVASVLTIPTGVVTDPQSTPNTLTGALATAAAGSETYAGATDAFMLRLAR
jgi:hypothetical protein